jgi:cytochrome c oxidase cbb3-type subunit I/II
MSNSSQVSFDDKVVRYFVIATVLWGVIGMLVGVLAAVQLAYWPANMDIPWLTFGRIRPLHTNAVIFAFAGNAIFAGIYYSTQRLLKTRMWSDGLSWFHFWGWQLIIVAAAITLPLGITVSKEYAELEFPIDIAIAIVWVAFAVNYFMTLAIRREKHIYVAIWFYIATILTVAMLHIGNSINVPVSFWKSYPVYAGLQDALVQWWYGHNAVAFFLTTPFLGLMYYFVPKAALRPVYSYRLSIIHFWSLIFLYIWAGPHHLLNTSLPEWAQTMGVFFSVVLIAPSWGGMLNGLLTLRGAWDKVRSDPILKFLVVGITFYGMSTFEGPMMSIKWINSLTHYTDYTIGHVHGGALGWNGFITFGMIYYLVPRLWHTEMYSAKLVMTHFWLSSIGIVLYITSMWAAGITQGLMWWSFTEQGMLAYPQFIETVVQLIPFYWIRVLGGVLYIGGTILLAFNMFQTIRQAKRSGVVLEDPTITAKPLDRVEPKGSWHHRLTARPAFFSILVLLAVIIGGPAQYIPLVAFQSNIPTIASVKPYTPLELEGRDIYIREGCYNCHSQMVRPFRDEAVRYGEYSKPGEFVYDRPFQFGSKRTGPDLHRVGGKYPDFWHYRHMLEPLSTSPGSIMPRYPWLYKYDLDTRLIVKKLRLMKGLGVPYSDEDVEQGLENLQQEAKQLVRALKEQGVEDVEGLEKKEIVALIAYLQRLGTDIKAEKSGN